MIVDYYHPNGWDDVGWPSIYLRTRTEKGLTTETIAPFDEGYIPPHCWVPAQINNRRLSRVISRYPGVTYHPDLTATGSDGTELMRLDCTNPTVLYEIKNEMTTYEADTPYEDQIMFHTFPNVNDIPDFTPRIWYFDMEWQPNGCVEEGATTMIAIDDTHADNPVEFAWNLEVDSECMDFI